jgi:microcystin-dependent protein
MVGEPFLSEIKIFAFNFAPKGWALCNGQLLPINQNQALFALLGTTYGGDGQTTFALPDLRGRAPIHMGSSFNLGQRGGEETHTLTISEMAAHTHQTRASADNATVAPPTSNFWCSNTGFTPYGNAANTAMSPTCISNVGGSQPHENRSPFLALNFCIALQGIFPSQN